jgi:hypothetical protein
MTRRKLIELDKLLPGYKTGPRTLNQVRVPDSLLYPQCVNGTA